MNGNDSNQPALIPTVNIFGSRSNNQVVKNHIRDTYRRHHLGVTVLLSMREKRVVRSVMRADHIFLFIIRWKMTSGLIWTKGTNNKDKYREIFSQCSLSVFLDTLKRFYSALCRDFHQRCGENAHKIIVCNTSEQLSDSSASKLRKLACNRRKNFFWKSSASHFWTHTLIS